MPIMGRRPTKHLNMPPRMRPRQKPGGIYYYYDLGGKPRKEIPLGNDYAAAIRKWSELEGNTQSIASIITLKHVVDRYRRDVIPTKAVRTQKDNHAELDKLFEFFGPDAPIDAIRPGHVIKYLEWRKDAPCRANREKALLSHIFNKARGWDLTDKANPCAGIKGVSEPGRNIYIEDDVFNAVYEASCQPIKDAMDLAYLTGQRVSDTLKMSEADIRDGFLHVGQGKTGKRLRMDTSGQLQAVIERIIKRKEGFKVRTLQLICNETGRPMRLKALQARFQRARERAAKTNKSLAVDIREFQIRDLRAKAGTDKLDSGDIVKAQRQLGHSTVAMTEHYLRGRRGDFVKPTK